jgi:hypothetical protein
MESDRKKFVCFVFLASLLLSFISFNADSIIGKDGFLYIETALLAQTDLRGAFAKFDWPWFPVLIGWLSKRSGMDPELSWRILGELMTAIACVVTVDMVHRKRPELTFWVALAVLSIPAFNMYRADLIRENGFWCFSMCAFWMAVAYEKNQRAKYIWGMVAAIFVAAFFRPEALAFLLILPVWSGVHTLSAEGAHQSRRWTTIILIAGALMILAAGWLVALKYYLLPERLCRFSAVLMSFLDSSVFPVDGIGTICNADFPIRGYGFSATAEGLSKILPFEYSRKDTKIILFFGIFVYLVWKIIKIFGPFSMPFIGNYFFRETESGGADSACREKYPWLITDIAAWIYFAVLTVFTVHHQFVSSRYLAFLGFLLLPRIADSLNRFVRRWPHLKTAVFIISVVTALSNVTHTNPPKNHLRDAGIWVGKNLKRGNDIYLDDARIAYYAGWRFYQKPQGSLDVALSGPYSYFVLGFRDEGEARKFPGKGLAAVATFRNRDKKTYVVFRKDNP